MKNALGNKLILVMTLIQELAHILCLQMFQ